MTPFIARLIKVLLQEDDLFNDTDENGGNTFHQLVEMSEENPEQAIYSFKLLFKYMKSNMRQLKFAITQQKNYFGVTPLELAAREAPPQVLKEILALEGVIRTTVASVKHQRTSLRGCTSLFEQADAVNPTASSIGDAAEGRSIYKLCRYDITRFEECHMTADRAVILEQLTRRDLGGMEKEDVEILTKDSKFQYKPGNRIGSHPG